MKFVKCNSSSLSFEVFGLLQIMLLKQRQNVNDFKNTILLTPNLIDTHDRASSSGNNLDWCRNATPIHVQIDVDVFAKCKM